MHRHPVATCLWPGLTQLSLQGQPRGLAAAILFAVVLNLGLIFSWGWTEWPGRAVSSALWGIVLVFWLGGAAWGWWTLRQIATLAPDSADDLYRRATERYLRGHHVEAEILIEQLLARNARDAEARLLRATLFRRTGRKAAAVDELKRLECLDGAARWREEIAAERGYLDRVVEAEGAGWSGGERGEPVAGRASDPPSAASAA